MCGIVAIVSPRVPVEPGRITRALDRIAHRGPDGRGVYIAPSRRAALGHVRLAIVDLAFGAQPFVSNDGATAAVVNGEIYDSVRLLGDLRARGHDVRTRSDSEIALHAYRELGDDCTRLFRGELAMAIWDEARGRLFCARDRFGIKPLFYAEHEGAVLVASEAKALFAAGLPAAWDDDGVYRAMHLALPNDRTLFHKVRQVPPGHTLVVEGGKVTLRSYWDAEFPARGRTRKTSLPEAVHEVGLALEDAVRTRLRADVPIGCYLSGGVDSSSVLGLAQRLGARGLRAFTVSFDDDAFDEKGPAARMAAHVGVPLDVVHVPRSAFADDFRAGVEVAEIPPYNGHAPARYFLSRAVRDAGLKVVLGGEGADELFAGYAFLRAALGERSGPPRPLVERLKGAFNPLNSRAFSSIGEVSPLLALVLRAVGFSGETLAYLGEKVDTVRGLLAPDFVSRHTRIDPYRDLLGTMPIGRLARAEPFRALTYLWMKTHFVGYVLAAERLDMAHGVEQRLPFLDHRLFEAVRDLPRELLFREGREKALLRLAVADVVTSEIRDARKQPFHAPPAVTGRGSPIAELTRDLVTSRRFRELPFFRADAIVKLLDELDGSSPEVRARFDPLYFFVSGMAVLADTLSLS